MITFTRDWNGYPAGASVGTLAATTEAAAVAAGAAVYGGTAYPLRTGLDRYGNAISLVDGDGNTYAPDGQRRVGVSVEGTTSIGVYDQLSTGEYVCTDTANGNWGLKLFLFEGDPLTKVGTATPLAGTDLATGGLKTGTGGTFTKNAGAKIVNAWPVSNGDIYFQSFDVDLKNYLWRAKAGTYTVGSDAGYSNKQACIDIGLNGGVHSGNIRHLSHRSFLEARVGGASHLFFCEYNVASGRTAGSGGAGKDQVVAYRSTDGGTTWSVFLEFNTGGSHQVAHFHGAVQDPYTGWIYFMVGDFNAEPALIAYNGTAAAVAANTSLAAIGSTAGYKVISGSELHRYCDLCFSETGIFSIPDADSESADPSTTAFVSTMIPRTLDYVVSTTPVQRSTNVPPVLAVQGADFALFASFISSGADSSRHHIWAADSKNGGWTLVAKIKNNAGSATYTPANFFIDRLDPSKIWLSFVLAQGGYVTAASASGSSVLLRLVPRGEVVDYQAG